MRMAERILVLAVDIDNDLYRKAHISGPVVGRNENLKAAAKLALADPQDADANAMFEAVRKFDELKAKGYSVNVATVTGAEKEGYVADVEFVRQIELVLERVKSDACVLVTDGSSDARVLPLLKNRIKVNSVDIVRMKQAPGIENTYFTVLEKLKEPHYSRIVFGIPAVLLILFALSYYFNFGWQLPVAIIGVYLILKGFGLEDALVNSFKGLGFSVERLSFVFYIGSIIFFLISLIIGYASYTTALTLTNDSLVLGSQAIEGFLTLFPISLVLFLVGRIIDLENKRMRYRAISQGTYVGYAIVALALLYLTSSWIIGQIYFWQFLVLSMIALLAGYGISLFSAFLRRRAIRRAKIKDKRVINDIGAYIGRITEVDSKRGLIFVKTDYGSVIKYDVDRITGVSDRVVIR
jgi:putative membrane protein